jgi:hypothetical protein
MGNRETQFKFGEHRRKCRLRREDTLTSPEKKRERRGMDRECIGMKEYS